MKVRSLMTLGVVAATGAAAMTLGGGAGRADAAVLAQWTFETSDPGNSAGPFAAESGAGSAAGGTGGTYSSPAGNGSANSYSSNGWDVGDYYEFSTSTVGYEDVTLTFDATSSSTGPDDFKVQYSVNGGAFTDSGFVYDVITNAAPPGAWNATTPFPDYAFSFDLSSITALDQAATIALRLVSTGTESANGGTVAATGTSRVDNVTISATPVPEPVAAGMLGVAALALFNRRNRRRG